MPLLVLRLARPSQARRPDVARTASLASVVHALWESSADMDAKKKKKQKCIRCARPATLHTASVAPGLPRTLSRPPTHASAAEPTEELGPLGVQVLPESDCPPQARPPLPRHIWPRGSLREGCLSAPHSWSALWSRANQVAKDKSLPRPHSPPAWTPAEGPHRGPGLFAPLGKPAGVRGLAPAEQRHLGETKYPCSLLPAHVPRARNPRGGGERGEMKAATGKPNPRRLCQRAPRQRPCSACLGGRLTGDCDAAPRGQAAGRTRGRTYTWPCMCRGWGVRITGWPRDINSGKHEGQDSEGPEELCSCTRAAPGLDGRCLALREGGGCKPPNTRVRDPRAPSVLP